METKKWQLSHMILYRGDLSFMDTEKLKISELLTDDQMSLMANMLSNILVQDWNELISVIYANNPDLFDVETGADDE